MPSCGCPDVKLDSGDVRPCSASLVRLVTSMRVAATRELAVVALHPLYLPRPPTIACARLPAKRARAQTAAVNRCCHQRKLLLIIGFIDRQSSRQFCLILAGQDAMSYKRCSSYDHHSC
ncbi:hypothetical protein H4Q26_016000 [Puccinia striiformis f. sp. tritici PST-130]|nr:hypothetical protein H4Q26_016000 [Puccinia striiformis f. sp. tritici PST-130]